MDNPWDIVEKKHIYANPWISVDEYEVINPSGNPGIYGTVNFKNRAVGIIPIDHEGNTWLVGQYRFPLQQYSWEIPMGGAPIDEPILQCAQRELSEETGLLASEWTELGYIHVSNCITNEEGYLFICKELEQGDAHPEETEQLTVKKLAFEEVFQMSMDGRITDALSIIAIQRVRLLGIA